MGEGIAITPRREATRRRLLDAAAQVVAETGLDAASVEAICERAGYTRGAFYSNYDSKEELFLDLCTCSARQQIAAVRERVARLETEGRPTDVMAVIREVLEVEGEDRWSIVLTSEIRLHALRVPRLAEAFLAQGDALAASVAQIVAHIVRANRMRLRTSPEAATRLLLTVWQERTERALLAGLGPAERQRELGAALAEVVELLVE